MLQDSDVQKDYIDPFQKKIKIQIQNEKNEKNYIWVSLEIALSIIFPLIFFNGPPPPIPGRSFREKFRYLISLHPWFRSGMLAENLIVFGFDLITKSESMYYICNMVKQRLNYPKNSIRIESDYRIMPPNDPSYALYWKNFENQVLGMTCSFGYPTFMITLTLNNKWMDCLFMKEIMELEFNKKNSENDLRFDPLVSLMIFEAHKKTIFSNRIMPLLNSMGLKTVTHYAIRLEFQNRGAPHIHSLIWTKKPLKEEIVQQTMFANSPSTSLPLLNSIVSHNMIHKCTKEYCRQRTDKCRFGFPKEVSSVTQFDKTTGSFVFKRDKGDENVVEYSPSLILAWRGHARVLPLKNDIITPEIEKIVFYVGKYQSKSEPIEKVIVNNATSNALKNCDEIFKNYITFLNARVIGPEEALARIFSFDFSSKDVEVMYLNLHAPSERQGTFNPKDGTKIGIDHIDWYFHRPLEFEGYSILEFYSNCETKTLQNCYGEVNNDSRPVHIREKGTLIPNEEGKFDYEKDLMKNAKHGQKYDFLSPKNCNSVRKRQCYLRKNQKIIVFTKSSVYENIEKLAYLYLLLSSCWRSDDEIMANQKSYFDACIFHGISLDNEFIEIAHVQLCIKFLFEGNNFLALQIAKNISLLRKENVSDLIIENELKKFESDQRYEFVIEHLKSLIESENQLKELDENPDSELTNEVVNKFIHYSFTNEEKDFAFNDLEEKRGLLNKEQKSVLDLVETGFKNSNFQILQYIDGKAGTGKSFIIKTIQSFCAVNNIPYVTCASTGIAASLIGGNTAHSTFILYPDKESQNIMHSALSPATIRGKCINLVKLIIIDEITMLNKGSLDAINEGLSRIQIQLNGNYIKDNLFGGKHVLIFGDLAQISAVVPKADDYLINANQFFESKVFSNFHITSLKKCERQSQDEIQLLSLLDSIRNCRDENESLPLMAMSLINNHYITKLFPDVDSNDFNSQIKLIHQWINGDYINGMIIAFENAIVDRINHSILNYVKNELNTEIYEIEANFYTNESHFFPNNTEKPSARSSNRFKLLTADFYEINKFKQALKKRKTICIVPMVLHLCKNSRIMLLKNIDVSSGLVNGARGTIKSLLEKNGKISTLMIQFDGRNDLVPIIKCRVHSYVLISGKEIYAWQFPLKLCYCVTSHKSQGQTLEKAAIYIAKPIPGHGCFYTACSRTKKIDGLLFWGESSTNEIDIKFHINKFIQDEHDKIVEKANIDEIIDIIPEYEDLNENDNNNEVIDIIPEYQEINENNNNNQTIDIVHEK